MNLSLILSGAIFVVCLCCLIMNLRAALIVSWVLKQVGRSGMTVEYVLTHEKQIRDQLKREKSWDCARDRYNDLNETVFVPGPFPQTTTQKPQTPNFNPEVVHDFQVFNNGDYKHADKTEWFKRETENAAVEISEIPTVNTVEELDALNNYSVDQSKPEEKLAKCDKYEEK